MSSCDYNHTNPVDDWRILPNGEIVPDINQIGCASNEYIQIGNYLYIFFDDFMGDHMLHLCQGDYPPEYVGRPFCPESEYKEFCQFIAQVMNGAAC
jgi:hypothetical protein